MNKKLFLSLILVSLFLINVDVNAQSCSNGAFQCGGGGQEKCVNSVWKLWNSCSYGCNGGYCNPGPGQVYGLDPNYVPPKVDPCAGQCSLGSFQCGSSGNQEKCVSGSSCNTWTNWNTCFNGCSSGYCNAAPTQPSGTAPEPVVQPAPVVTQPAPAAAQPVAQSQTITLILPAQAGKQTIASQCRGVFDFDNNGVDFTDFVEFVKRFSANDLSVDYNVNYGIDVGDFFCFRSYFGTDVASTIDCKKGKICSDIDKSGVVSFADFTEYSSCNGKRNDAECNNLFDYDANGIIDLGDASCFRNDFNKYAIDIPECGIMGKECNTNTQCSVYNKGTQKLYCSFGQDGKKQSSEQGHCCSEKEYWVPNPINPNEGSCVSPQTTGCNCPVKQGAQGRFRLNGIGDLYEVRRLNANFGFDIAKFKCKVGNKVCVEINRYGVSQPVLLEPEKY